MTHLPATAVPGLVSLTWSGIVSYSVPEPHRDSTLTSQARLRRQGIGTADHSPRFWNIPQIALEGTFLEQDQLEDVRTVGRSAMSSSVPNPRFNIHIKTASSGGQTKHGYPDETYFQRQTLIESHLRLASCLFVQKASSQPLAGP